MATKLTPKKVDLKIRKLSKEITKLKALKEELRKVDKLGKAVRGVKRKHSKKVKHRRKKR